MKLSVIVTIYNREAVLRRCVDSILAQNMTDYEVILVDDGSRDGSRRIMETYERSHPERIRCLYRENGGVARARNAGLAAACGEYIAYVDSDDWLPENVLGQLERMSERAERTRVPVLVALSHEAAHRGHRKLLGERARIEHHADALFELGEAPLGRTGHFLAEERDGAAVGADEPEYRLDGGGLAGAVGADEAHHAAGRHA